MSPWWTMLAAVAIGVLSILGARYLTGQSPFDRGDSRSDDKHGEP